MSAKKDQSQAVVDTLYKWNTVSASTYIFSSILTKLSLAFYLRRIIPTESFRRRHFLTCVMIAMIVINIGHFGYRLIFCHEVPQVTSSSAGDTTMTGFSDVTDTDVNIVASVKDPSIEGYCAAKSTPHVAMVLLAAIANVIADIAFIILPLPEMLKSLKEKRMAKLAFLVLVLATAGVIVALSRLPFLYGYVAQSYHGGELLTAMAMVEPGLTIVCGCFMTLRPLGEKYLPRWLTGAHKSYAEMDERNGSMDSMSHGEVESILDVKTGKIREV